ncbi:MAG: UDP-N-acetylglucosamine diphosphorylase/glucosamine-1-phosphate N-acetyltransferase [Thermodesulfovibrio sp.]|nr:UDP-N-acetylglucosamine diphosphorylase/glucosamine-1-phosphate N-acetyltransferase [Thermodesulfovibrio sp.]
MKIAAVILAAGEGKRMKSPLPKVLHRVCGETMLGAVIAAARRVRPEKIVVVAGKHLERIREAVGTQGISFALQAEPLGTGHAVMAALPDLAGFRGDLLVMNGDTPLVRPETLRSLLQTHRRKKNDLTVLSFMAENPEAYGRVVRDRTGQAAAIVEEKDADAEQKKIAEVNSGVYVFGAAALSLLEAIPVNPLTKEYYLTDLVSLAGQQGLRADACCMGEEAEFMGVNTRQELIRAEGLMRKSIIAGLIAKGVGFIDPGAVYIDQQVSVGADTLVYPNVCLEGSTTIGPGTVIYPNVRIRDSRLGKKVIIRDSTVVEGSEISDAAVVGPFAHIRPGSAVGREARIGNFVELKKTVVGRGSKASHLSYLGDANIGKGVNIGAGTITCNYDGVKKHLTVIEDGVFIGSDSQLVAPVRIGKGAYVGAGSTITKDVPREALAVSRVAQQHISGWAKKRKQKQNRGN